TDAAATFIVGRDFSINSSGFSPGASASVHNFGMSTMTVGRDFTIYGDGGSIVYAGEGSTDAASLTVGGSFSLGAHSLVSVNGCTSEFSTDTFTLGANSSFEDYGTMSVAGVFDPGTGDANNHNIVS